MDNKMYENVDDLKKLKNDFGESFAHLCRTLFPTILEKQGLLYKIIIDHFAKSKYLCEDIIREKKVNQFKDYVYYIYDEIINPNKIHLNTKSVKELLKEKNYTLYECKTNEDIQRFKKYYIPGEELCTFNDPNRINNHYIFFIVKDGAENIDRWSFSIPKRNDDYSVSVLDLQFDKGAKQRVSIKSRYNHSVNNPDATHSNNLENIADGLTDAFEREYGFNIGKEYKSNFELDHYTRANDNRFYRYNYEINDIYYCTNNIIIDDGRIIDKYSDKSRYTFMDYFILDEKEKKIIKYDNKIVDSFMDGLNNIKNITITNEIDCKKIVLKLEDSKEAIIKLDCYGRIIGYENKYLKECKDTFLYKNEVLKELNLPNLESCGSYFLYNNDCIQELNLPNLEKCGDCFVYYNMVIKELNLPKLNNCGNYFLYWNRNLQELNLPKLKCCGNSFVSKNYNIKSIYLPNLEKCEDSFLESNVDLESIYLPNMRECGNGFIAWNNNIYKVYLHNLEKCGDNFFFLNKSIKSLSIPNLHECGNHFLYFNTVLEEVSLPNIIKCGDYFLYSNNALRELYLPSLINCGSYFLFKNNTIQSLSIPNLKDSGSHFTGGKYISVEARRNI